MLKYIKKNRMICHCKQVDYITIRKAMIAGACILDEIKEKIGAGTGDGRCKALVQNVIDTKR